MFLPDLILFLFLSTLIFNEQLIKLQGQAYNKKKQFKKKLVGMQELQKMNMEALFYTPAQQSTFNVQSSFLKRNINE